VRQRDELGVMHVLKDHGIHWGLEETTHSPRFSLFPRLEGQTTMEQRLEAVLDQL